MCFFVSSHHYSLVHLVSKEFIKQEIPWGLLLLVNVKEKTNNHIKPTMAASRELVVSQVTDWVHHTLNGQLPVDPLKDASCIPDIIRALSTSQALNLVAMLFHYVYSVTHAATGRKRSRGNDAKKAATTTTTTRKPLHGLLESLVQWHVHVNGPPAHPFPRSVVECKYAEDRDTVFALWWHHVHPLTLASSWSQSEAEVSNDGDDDEPPKKRRKTRRHICDDEEEDVEHRDHNMDVDENDSVEQADAESDQRADADTYAANAQGRKMLKSCTHRIVQDGRRCVITLRPGTLVWVQIDECDVQEFSREHKESKSDGGDVKHRAMARIIQVFRKLEPRENPQVIDGETEEEFEARSGLLAADPKRGDPGSLGVEIAWFWSGKNDIPDDLIQEHHLKDNDYVWSDERGILPVSRIMGLVSEAEHKSHVRRLWYSPDHGDNAAAMVSLPEGLDMQEVTVEPDDEGDAAVEPLQDSEDADILQTSEADEKEDDEGDDAEMKLDHAEEEAGDGNPLQQEFRNCLRASEDSYRTTAFWRKRMEDEFLKPIQQTNAKPERMAQLVDCDFDVKVRLLPLHQQNKSSPCWLCGKRIHPVVAALGDLGSVGKTCRDRIVRMRNAIAHVKKCRKAWAEDETVNVTQMFAEMRALTYSTR